MPLYRSEGPKFRLPSLSMAAVASTASKGAYLVGAAERDSQ
jgi:hypothetical protein